MNAETVIRLSAFLGILAVMAGWEVVAPRRRLRTSKRSRWAVNLLVVALNSILLRALFAAGAIGAAAMAAQHGLGLLNMINGPAWMKWLLAVVLLDFALYLQHVMFHAVPTLWRLHMMHHADLDVDVTTGARFHPLEVMLSMGIKLATVMLIGAAPAAVLAFEILLNATSMFNHSNVRIPVAIDQVLRWLVVTPDMHRIHHSVLPKETNTNFGFNLPWWDRLLGTYRTDPVEGQEDMVLGLEQFRNHTRLNFTGVLLLPFLGKPGNYPLGRED
jgi:sterol desaturase/sphingolipid hydroxylase (fatty acid hydroxylase superfamily)